MQNEKRTSVFMRLLSVMLALLLCVGTAAIGISPVHAREFGEEAVDVSTLFPGDMVNEGTILRVDENCRKGIEVYFNDGEHLLPGERHL